MLLADFDYKLLFNIIVTLNPSKALYKNPERGACKQVKDWKYLFIGCPTPQSAIEHYLTLVDTEKKILFTDFYHLI